jgi:hypothetical protein
MAVKSAETVEWALRRAGVEDLKELHGLEVGAGECGQAPLWCLPFVSTPGRRAKTRHICVLLVSVPLTLQAEGPLHPISPISSPPSTPSTSRRLSFPPCPSTSQRTAQT